MLLILKSESKSSTILAPSLSATAAKPLELTSPLLTTVPPIKFNSPLVLVKVALLIIEPGLFEVRATASGVPFRTEASKAPLLTLNQLSPKRTPFPVVAVKAAGTLI